MITSIASGAFTGLGSLAALYITERHSGHYSDHACLILHRYMDTLTITKAPFNMLSGTPLTELYVTCELMLIIFDCACPSKIAGDAVIPGKILLPHMRSF